MKHYIITAFLMAATGYLSFTSGRDTGEQEAIENFPTYAEFHDQQRILNQAAKERRHRVYLERGIEAPDDMFEYVNELTGTPEMPKGLECVDNPYAPLEASKAETYAELPEGYRIIGGEAKTAKLDGLVTDLRRVHPAVLQAYAERVAEDAIQNYEQDDYQPDLDGSYSGRRYFD